MDFAYSIEYKNVIDAEDAYHLYQSGVIQDKRAFECSHENCNAQVTCINIDKKAQQSKQSVHYRCYGEHDSNCPFENEKSVSSEIAGSGKEKGYKTSTVYILTPRPKDYYKVKKDNNEIPEERNFVKNKYRKSLENTDINAPLRKYFIAPLVTKFLSHWNKKEYLALENIFIQKNTHNISFSDFFIEIKDQDISTLSEYPRIYFGKAYINSYREKSVKINFDKKFTYLNKAIRPSLIIDLKEISHFKNSGHWKKRLLENVDSKKPYLFFVYGKPTPKGFDDSSIQYPYVRFYTKELDYLDLRID